MYQQKGTIRQVTFTEHEIKTALIQYGEQTHDTPLSLCDDAKLTMVEGQEGGIDAQLTCVFWESE